MNASKETWDTDELRQAVKGVFTVGTFFFHGPMGAMFRMDTDNWRLSVVTLDTRGDIQEKFCVMLGCENMLCMRRECLNVWHGFPMDVTHIQANRDNGVWVGAEGHLCYRLGTRKNKRFGSTLVRACVCKIGGARFCAACTSNEYLGVDGRQTGDILWGYKPHDFSRSMKS